MVNDGMSEQSRPSTYMDQVKSGWKDAWVAMAFYTALKNMVELETVVDNEEKRKLYQSLLRNVSGSDEIIFLHDKAPYMRANKIQLLLQDNGVKF